MRNSHQDALRVVAWFLVCCECVLIASRLALKKFLWKKFGWDDGLIVAALLFSIAASIAAASAAVEGLGVEQPLLTYGPEELNLLQKSIYVSEIFHIACLSSVKLSILALVRMLFVSQPHRRLVDVATAVTAVWGLSGVLVVAFQCSLPRPWDFVMDACIDISAFWDYFTIVGIVLDLLITVLPAGLMWRLQMPWSKKLKVIVHFLPWIIAVAVAGVSLGYTHQFWARTQEPFSIVEDTLWPWFICCQVLRAVSLIAASAPYLRQFIESFPSGLLQPDEIRRHGLTEKDIRHGYAVHRSNGSSRIVYVVQDNVEQDE